MLSSLIYLTLHENSVPHPLRAPLEGNKNLNYFSVFYKALGRKDADRQNASRQKKTLIIMSASKSCKAYPTKLAGYVLQVFHSVGQSKLPWLSIFKANLLSSQFGLILFKFLNNRYIYHWTICILLCNSERLSLD